MSQEMKQKKKKKEKERKKYSRTQVVCLFVFLRIGTLHVLRTLISYPDLFFACPGRSGYEIMRTYLSVKWPAAAKPNKEGFLGNGQQKVNNGGRFSFAFFLL